METTLVWILVLSGIGILNTLYLSWHAITKTDVKCLFFPPEWCKKVQHAPQSRTLGIPNPYLGLLMYVGLAVLTYLFHVGTLTVFWPIGLIIVFGFLFSSYFMYVQAVVLKAYCTWCVLSALEFLLLFSVLLYRLYA